MLMHVFKRTFLSSKRTTLKQILTLKFQNWCTFYHKKDMLLKAILNNRQTNVWNLLMSRGKKKRDLVKKNCLQEIGYEQLRDRADTIHNIIANYGLSLGRDAYMGGRTCCASGLWEMLLLPPSHQFFVASSHSLLILQFSFLIKSLVWFHRYLLYKLHLKIW